MKTAKLSAIFLVGLTLTVTSCSTDRKKIVSDSTPTTTQVATETGTETGAAGQTVGFLLPDSSPTGRWEMLDRPLITAACTAANIVCDIQSANSKSEMYTMADDMLAAKVSVLAIANIDSSSSNAIQEKAAAQGVKLIDYDRLTLGGKTDVYISFDNVAIGRAQGEGLITCFGGAEAARRKRIIQLHGSPTSSVATLVKKGSQDALRNSGVKTIAEEAVPDSDVQRGGQIFERLFTNASGKIDGVLAANDGLSLAAQAVLTDAGVTVATTGQDATRDGLAAILRGTQCMTVYKPIKAEADAAVAAAATLLKGDLVSTPATINDGVRDIPYVQVAVVSIFKEQVKDVVADGFVTKEELCTGDIASLCAPAGIE
jgi:D-xylose transport system substrate-binding protein